MSEKEITFEDEQALKTDIAAEIVRTFMGNNPSVNHYDEYTDITLSVCTSAEFENDTLVEISVKIKDPEPQVKLLTPNENNDPKNFRSTLVLELNSDDIQQATKFIEEITNNLSKEMEVTNVICLNVIPVRENEHTVLDNE